MLIHKEGKKIVFGMWALLLLVAGTLWRMDVEGWLFWVLPLGLLSIFVSRFFRVPKRKTPHLSTDMILSPADGKIVGVEKIDHNGTPYIMVSIFMSIWNVHINWIPLSGTIKKRSYYPGKFLMAIQPKASELNERSETIINSPAGDITVVQVAGAVARRIITYPTENEQVRGGQELGFIKFGSRVDILFPTSYTPLVVHGQKVKGIESVIASYKQS